MDIITLEKVALRKIFVLMGQVLVTEEPQEYVTILGSCVSVCLWDRKKKIGGINHFLLPETVNDANSLKGGIASTRKLIQSIANLTHKSDLEAKVFGGANRFFSEASFLKVGEQNIIAAKIILKEAGIPIVQQDTGGKEGRKIYFNTHTGVVREIKIKHSEPDIDHSFKRVGIGKN